MSFKAFIKKCVIEYFIITTCITAAIAVLGLTLNPQARFGYESYFSPFIFSFISLAPSWVTYSRKELPMRQMLFRKILHFILLEAALITFGVWAKLIGDFADAFFFGLSVLLVYITVNFISWRLDIKDATEINKTLKSMQGRDSI